jgi:toprim domain protein
MPEPLSPIIIVEGSNDRRRLRQVLPDTIPIELTYGIPSAERLEALAELARHRAVVIMTDNDAAGRRIRGILADAFPDAIHLHTKRGYGGVEHTPLEYLEARMRAIGLIGSDEEPAW